VVQHLQTLKKILSDICAIPIDDNGTMHFKNVNDCLNTNICSYLETSGGQSSNLYLNVVHFFSTPLLIGHLQQLKAVVLLH
jgi:hypothetical protein